MIDQNTIQTVLDRADIVDVVGDFVSLKKRGVNYLGLCPFHNEKTPSFTVSPAKGIYKCFGCGKGGNSINFVMDIEQLSYPEAIKHLAKKYHIEIVEEEQTPEQIQAKNERESILIVNSFANKFFVNQLHDTTQGKAVGLAYFRERSFRDDMVKKFELGFSPEKRDALTEAALRKGYKLEYLTKSGLTIDKNDYRFDRFAGRVIFPIHSLTGKVIAFGGRIMKTDKKTAKYLNSPESEVYHKSNILYGIFHARSAITKSDKCFMVEGYTDVISFHQSGIENVVASSGTSLTTNQIRLVKRFTNNLTIIYDGDAAGIKASLRGIDLVLEEGMNVKVVPLPEGEDPDSFAKSRSASELLAHIENNEKDFIKFKTNLLLEEAKSDPVKRAHLIGDIIRSISVIPDMITRSVYVKECSTILNVKEEVLYSEINKIKGNKAEKDFYRTKRENEKKKAENKKNVLPNDINICGPFEMEIIRLLLLYGKDEFKLVVDGDEAYVKVSEYIFSEFEYEEFNFYNNDCKRIFTEYEQLFIHEKEPEQTWFTNHTDSQISRLAVDLVSSPHQLSKLWTKEFIINTDEIEIETALPALILKYKLKRIELSLKEVEKEIKQTEQLGEQEDLIKAIQKKMVLDRLRADVAKELGDVVILS